MELKNTKCLGCTYGANFKQGSIIYFFKKAIKEKNGKMIEINYNQGQLGCRNSDRNQLEENCIQNNFSEFRRAKYDGK